MVERPRPHADFFSIKELIDFPATPCVLWHEYSKSCKKNPCGLCPLYWWRMHRRVPVVGVVGLVVVVAVVAGVVVGDD